MRNGEVYQVRLIPEFGCVRAEFRMAFGSTDLDVERQAVIGELDVGRKRAVGRRMRQIVADVRQIRLCRRQAFDDGQRFGHAEVRGVRPMSQRVEHQYIEPFEERER